jgi:threonine dehydratase
MSGAVQGERLVGLAEIESAVSRLQTIALKTPLHPADAVSEVADAEVRLKCESLQRTGSFKIRGAYNFVSQLSSEALAHGIITYSSGNHGQAVALAGKLHNARVVVVMPTTAPKVKREGAERLGAEVVYAGTTSVERRLCAEAIARDEGLAMVPPFDDRQIIAGQGTVGLEIAKAWPQVDVVLVPIGGGGLASGVAAAVKRMLPAARVVGVEPEGAASMRRALEEGGPVFFDRIDTIADGLAPVIAGALTFEHARELLDDVVTVDEASIRRAAALLINRQKLVVEFSGAATTAALLARKVSDVRGRRVAAIVSGGNLDPSLLPELLSSAAKA